MTSCRWFEEMEEELTYDRTVLVYIAAENDIYSYAQDDINEMLQAAEDVPSNSKFIIYVDDRKFPRILSIEHSQDSKNKYKILEQYAVEQDSGDPETLRLIMEWTTKNYPALSYGLVLWSHGDAWIPSKSPIQRSICIDNNQNTDSNIGSQMNIADIAEVLSTLPKLDFILFDACFMQSVEVAYELRQTTKYIIASPAEIPGPGAPYHRIVKPMFASPFDANKIAEEYFQSYNGANRDNTLQGYGVLLSVVDCNLLESLAATTAEMTKKYASKDVELALNDIQRYCPKPSNSRPNYYDMNGYMRSMITDEADYMRWKSALDRTVCYTAATPWWYSRYSSKSQESVDLETYSGISCYVPQNKSLNTKLNAMFRTTSWYKAAGWQQVGW